MNHSSKKIARIAGLLYLVKAKKFINIIAAVGALLIISGFVLLKLNMLPVRYQY
jgi:hypothetical protein